MATAVRSRRGKRSSGGLASGQTRKPARGVPGALRLSDAVVQACKSKGLANLAGRDRAVARAVALLVHRGVLTGARSKKISTRVDPGVMEAARQRFGLTNDSDVINASLAMAVAPDRFKAWLLDTQDTLPDDFELPI